MAKSKLRPYCVDIAEGLADYIDTVSKELGLSPGEVVRRCVAASLPNVAEQVRNEQHKTLAGLPPHKMIFELIKEHLGNRVKIAEFTGMGGSDQVRAHLSRAGKGSHYVVRIGEFATVELDGRILVSSPPLADPAFDPYEWVEETMTGLGWPKLPPTPSVVDELIAELIVERNKPKHENEDEDN